MNQRLQWPGSGPCYGDTSEALFLRQVKRLTSAAAKIIQEARIRAASAIEIQVAHETQVLQVPRFKYSSGASSDIKFLLR